MSALPFLVSATFMSGSVILLWWERPLGAYSLFLIVAAMSPAFRGGGVPGVPVARATVGRVVDVLSTFFVFLAWVVLARLCGGKGALCGGVL